jgi:hypothetical protein
MASSCPPGGTGSIICHIVQFPGLGPGSGSASQVVDGAVGAAASSTLHEIAAAMASAADGLLKTLSTMWMNVNTPGLSTAADLQTYTRWITTAVAVVAILIAAGQMAIRRRGQPASIMFAGLARVVITGAAATFLVQTAGSLGDRYSADLMGSTVAHIGSGGWSGIVSTALIASTIAPGDAMTLIIAFLIIISSLIQLMLMILRVGLLVVLTGTLPLTAAASMTEQGQTWWRRHLGWLIAWLLYKPAAALLYISAFALTHTKGLVGVLAGFMLLILSVLILPALLKVIVPMTASLGAASGGSLAMAAAGALATGAIRAGLHRPPGTRNSPAPSGDGQGPSGAGVAPGDPPPGTPPSSPAERRSSEPPPSGSPEPSTPDSGDKAPPEAPSPRKAAAFVTGLAAGVSAGNPSWRSRQEPPAQESEPAEPTEPEGSTSDHPNDATPDNGG